MSYTYAAGNGISASISLEDANSTATGVNEFDENAPSLVGTVRVAQSWGAVAITGAIVDNETLDTGYMIGAGASVKVGSAGNFNVNVRYSEDANAYNTAGYTGVTANAEVFSAYAAYTHKFSSKFSGIIGVEYVDADYGVANNYEALEINGGIYYAPVSGLDIGLELYYVDDEINNADAREGNFHGLFRIQRSF